MDTKRYGRWESDIRLLKKFTEHRWTIDGVQEGYTAYVSIESYMLRTGTDLAE